MTADIGTASLWSGPYRRASSSICALVSLYAFAEMGVAAALPDAVVDLGGLGAFGWVFTGFLASSVVGMSSSAAACDRFGPRRPIVVWLALFITGLVVAGTATTMTALIGGRVLQGLSGGGLMTAIYVLAGTRFPAVLRPRLFAAIAMCWVVPGIVGPTASGALTEHVGWRWIFLGLAPLALAAAIGLAPALADADAGGGPDRGQASSWSAQRARVAAAVLAAAGIAAIQLGAEQLTGRSPVLLAAGTAALVVALRHLLPPGTALLRSAVGTPVALRGLTAGALFGVEAVIPLMMSTQHGLGSLRAAIPLACAGLPCALAARWIGRLGGEHDLDRRVRRARLGFVLLGSATAAFVWLSRPAAPSWLMAPGWVIAGFGIGLVVPSMSVLALERTTDERRAADAAALQIADTTASCLTTGFSGVLVAYASRGALGFTTAFTIIGATMTMVALGGALGAGRLRGAATAAP